MKKVIISRRTLYRRSRHITQTTVARQRYYLDHEFHCDPFVPLLLNLLVRKERTLAPTTARLVRRFVPTAPKTPSKTTRASEERRGGAATAFDGSRCRWDDGRSATDGVDHHRARVEVERSNHGGERANVTRKSFRNRIYARVPPSPVINFADLVDASIPVVRTDSTRASLVEIH